MVARENRARFFREPKQPTGSDETHARSMKIERAVMHAADIFYLHFAIMHEAFENGFKTLEIARRHDEIKSVVHRSAKADWLREHGYKWKLKIVLSEPLPARALTGQPGDYYLYALTATLHIDDDRAAVHYKLRWHGISE